MNTFQVLFMTLQRLSTAVIDLFFLMTVFVTFMTVMRFGQFSAIGKMTTKKAGEVTVELVVQGIAVGAIFSLMLVFLGMPVVFSEYLYFLLPMSFIIGFYHVRFTNLIYAATMMSVIGMFMSGGTIGEVQIPDIEFSVAGMALLTGGLMVFIAALLALTGTRHLKPIVAKKDQHVVLGFAQQRFWAVPIVALVAISEVLGGEAVSMPEWWPMLPLNGPLQEESTLILLPLLFILNHGSISFGFSPKKHIQHQVLIQGVTGIFLFAIGWIGSINGNMEGIILVVMLLAGALPEILWNYMEGDERFLYLMDHHGVYIGSVQSGTLARTLGFYPGDRITAVNGVAVEDLKALEVIYRDQSIERELTLVRLGEGPINIDVQRLDIIEETFGLELLPQHIAKVFDYKDVTQMNMMHLLRYTVQRDGSEN